MGNQNQNNEVLSPRFAIYWQIGPPEGVVRRIIPSEEIETLGDITLRNLLYQQLESQDEKLYPVVDRHGLVRHAITDQG
jgi:hypothetical protein